MDANINLSTKFIRIKKLTHIYNANVLDLFKIHTISNCSKIH